MLQKPNFPRELAINNTSSQLVTWAKRWVRFIAIFIAPWVRFIAICWEKIILFCFQTRENSALQYSTALNLEVIPNYFQIGIWLFPSITTLTPNVYFYIKAREIRFKPYHFLRRPRFLSFFLRFKDHKYILFTCGSMKRLGTISSNNCLCIHIAVYFKNSIKDCKK